MLATMTNVIRNPTINLTMATDSGTLGDGITSITDPTFTGLAQAGSTVSVRIDGKLVATVLANAAGAWYFTPSSPLTSGKHTVTATDADAAGDTSAAATFSLQIDTSATKPTIGLTAATDSGLIGDGITNVTKPDFAGWADPGATLSVQIDGKLVGTTLVSGNGMWRYDPTAALTSGNHTVTTSAVDVAGNTSAVTSFALNIDTTPPPTPTVGLSVASDSGVAGDGITNVTDPTFTGLAQAGSTVSVRIDGMPAGAALANAAGVWSVTPTAALTSGNHTVTTAAVDVAGNTSAVTSFALNIDTTPPPAPTVGLSVASDSGIAGDGITNVTDPTFTGLAQAGSTVSVRIEGMPAPTQPVYGVSPPPPP
jgi:large repetitive protein